MSDNSSMTQNYSYRLKIRDLEEFLIFTVINFHCLYPLVGSVVHNVQYIVYEYHLSKYLSSLYIQILCKPRYSKIQYLLKYRFTESTYDGNSTESKD